MGSKCTVDEIRQGLQSISRPRVFLDCEKRRLKIDGKDLSALLNRTDWIFLTALAIRRPLLGTDEYVVPRNERIGDTALAQTCRRELQRRLPPGAVQLLVKTVRDLGYCLAPDVFIRGRGEARLAYRDPSRVQELSHATHESRNF